MRTLWQALVLSAQALAAAAAAARGVWLRAGRGEEQPAALPCHRLPPELRLRILLEAVAACAESSSAPSPVRFLLLSRETYKRLIPALYAHIALASAPALRHLRITLLRRPELAAHVRALRLTGHECASPLGAEQLFLALPHLDQLALDAGAAASICQGTLSRLRSGARPGVLRLDLRGVSLPPVQMRALFALPLCEKVSHVVLLGTPWVASLLAHDIWAMPALGSVELHLDRGVAGNEALAEVAAPAAAPAWLAWQRTPAEPRDQDPLSYEHMAALRQALAVLHVPRADATRIKTVLHHTPAAADVP